MDKAAIADALNDIATLLELKGENPFKIRAYQSGARLLETLEEDLGTLIETDRLRSLKGIGDALGDKITTLHREGRLEFLEKLRTETPPGLIEMLTIPGLGAKKVKAMHDKLGVDTIAALQAACEAGKVAELDGFGAKSQEKILTGIQRREAYGKRHLWWDAKEVSDHILEGLKTLPQVIKVEAAGSLRRGLETVGDLDFIVGANEGAPIMDWFAAQAGVIEVTAKGETKTSVRFEGGLQADLRVVPPEIFSYALHHFTGSKNHNVQMRQRALARGLSLSEWGLEVRDPLLHGGGIEGEKLPPVADEAELFGRLGLSFITPELREGLEEIEQAEKGPLPKLLEDKDLRGAFHNHTTASDGRNTLEEMARKADQLGWEYLGISDHSKSSFQANGLDRDRLLRQVDQIRALNASGRFRVRLLAGTECDILPDGSLDFDDATLAALDYTVVSVHSAFPKSEDEMTARILRALSNPYADMLGHATGRLLLRREGYPINYNAIIDFCAKNGRVIELNAHPMRLDLDWRHWRHAASAGVLCAINPDAHETAGLEHVRAGVKVARKGWLEARHVLNTRPLAGVLSWLAERRR